MGKVCPDCGCEFDTAEHGLECPQCKLQEILEQDPYKNCDCEICRPL